MQVLADGRVLVGWGNLPYFSEFAPDGTLLLDGQSRSGTSHTGPSPPTGLAIRRTDPRSRRG
jgi:hypothetical protein